VQQCRGIWVGGLPARRLPVVARNRQRAGGADARQALGDSAVARSHFQAALQAAWSTQAIPHTLEELAGMALALAEERPGHARALAELVSRHPATTQEAAIRRRP
jgi:hypothetical protein